VNANHRSWFRLAALALVLLFGLGRSGAALVGNLGYIYLVRSGVVSASYAAHAEAFLGQAARVQPSAEWGLALLARWQGDAARSRTHLQALLVRGELSRLPAVQALRTDDVALARQAWQQYGDQPLAAFWLGKALAASDPPGAIVAYEQGLRLNGRDGVIWVELGWLYRRQGQYAEALYAYDQGCRRRDRGGNGCWQAGLLAEELGLTDRAADYYRQTLQQIPGYGPAVERLNRLAR
jgi:tetratricopeptide (TPR) repeat protein